MTGLYRGYEFNFLKTSLLRCNLHTVKLNHLSKVRKLCSLHHNPVLEHVHHPQNDPSLSPSLCLLSFFSSFPPSYPFFLSLC